jgi:hypothetical protein
MDVGGSGVRAAVWRVSDAAEDRAATRTNEKGACLNNRRNGSGSPPSLPLANCRIGGPLFCLI